jgi:hypothetical protein
MVIKKYNNVKLFILVLAVIIASCNTSKSQPVYVLDTVITQISDIQWEEVSHHIEEEVSQDSFLDGESRSPMYNMLMFTDTNRVSENMWHLYSYTFRFKDSLKQTMSIPTFSPLRAHAIYRDGKIVIHYYQFRRDIIDEILFFDEKKLIIRHKGINATERIEYRRLKRKQE